MPRQALALVELLVVVAVLGALMALLLPAVEAARQAGRRTVCGNQLRQINAALLGYVESRSVFPPGAVLAPNYPAYDKWYDPWTEAAEGGSGKHGTSWLLQILPWIGQEQLFQRWDFTRSVSGNAAVAGVDLPLFYCPSRRRTVRADDQQIMFLGWTSGGTDYGACLGRNNGWRNDHAGCQGVGHKFLVSNTLFDPRKKGIFGPNTATGFSDIVDGASNTIAVGELQRLLPDPKLDGINKTSRTSNDGWATGGVATLFTTATYHEDGDLGQPGGLNNWFFESAGSDHPGGAHFGMADGAVRFVSENIDSQVYALLGSMADRKPTTVP